MSVFPSPLMSATRGAPLCQNVMADVPTLSVALRHFRSGFGAMLKRMTHPVRVASNTKLVPPA